jgi:hypothetical protein
MGQPQNSGLLIVPAALFLYKTICLMENPQGFPWAKVLESRKGKIDRAPSILDAAAFCQPVPYKLFTAGPST